MATIRKCACGATFSSHHGDSCRRCQDAQRIFADFWRCRPTARADFEMFAERHGLASARLDEQGRLVVVLKGAIGHIDVKVTMR